MNTLYSGRHRQYAVERVGLLFQFSRVELFSHGQVQPPLRVGPLGLALYVMYIAAKGIRTRHVGRHGPCVIILLTKPYGVHRQIGLGAVFCNDHCVADETILVTALRVLLLVVFTAGGFLSTIVLFLKFYPLLIPAGGILSGHDAGIEGFVALHNGIYLLHCRTAANGQDHLLVAARAFHRSRCPFWVGDINNIRTRRVPLAGTESTAVLSLQPDTGTGGVSVSRSANALGTHDWYALCIQYNGLDRHLRGDVVAKTNQLRMAFVTSCGASPFVFRSLIIRTVFTDEIGRFGDCVSGVIREDRVRTSVTCSVHTRQLLVEIHHRQILLRCFVLTE